LDTAELLDALKASADEIPHLQGIKGGLHHPHVKSWKTKLEGLLREGGSTCEKALQSLRKFRAAFGGSAFIKDQTYATQLEALERTLRQTIQTIQVFGRPEDKDVLPNWGKPKSQQLAVGHLKVGEEEIDTGEITISEVLACLISLGEDSNHLSPELQEPLMRHLNAILDNELLQPFLSQKLDALLGHWPEFQTK